MKSIIQTIPKGFPIPASVIGLPTTRAEIKEVTLVKKEETGFRTEDFYRVSGAIHPADPEGYDINFQAGFPTEWNGRLLQYGGGGLEGNVASIEWVSIGQSLFWPPQLLHGYISVYGDSGHTAPADDPWSCDWALNQEALENYAFKAFKKIKDVIVYLADYLYGEKPEKVYFAGGSNGGPETLKVIQNYPKDYDGAVCLFPVVNYILKVIKDTRIATDLARLGSDAMIDKDLYAKVQQTIMDLCDELDGAKDGIISDLLGAREKRD